MDPIYALRSKITDTSELILMCKDKGVYNVTTNTIINFDLLPGTMHRGNTEVAFNRWVRNRKYNNSNSSARSAKKIVFGSISNDELMINTRLISLSDCYWLKYSNESVLFSSVTPYNEDNWSTDISNTEDKFIKQNNTLSATLNVDGRMCKYWRNPTDLVKYDLRNDISIEYQAYLLCRLLNIECAEYMMGYDVHHIISKNFTDTNVLFEAAQQSGVIKDDFTVEDVLSLYGIQGIDMFIIDAIIGNGDRHYGNFGSLRSADTGYFIRMAPLYDFDTALQSPNCIKDGMVNDLILIYTRYPIYRNHIKEKLKMAFNFYDVPEFNERARFIARELFLLK